jgi:hypothetical protein
MNIKDHGNEACVGDIRLCAIDKGYDPRLTDETICLPVEIDCSVGYETADGQRHTVVGRREEILAVLRAAGYRVK